MKMIQMECERCEIVYHSGKKERCDLCGGNLRKESGKVYKVEARGW